MICVPNNTVMLVDTKYVPAGKYTMALVMLAPLHPLAHLLPSLIAFQIAFVSSYR